MDKKDNKKKHTKITKEQKEKAIRIVKKIGVGFSIGLNVLIGLTLIIGSIGAKDTNEHIPVSTDQVSEVSLNQPRYALNPSDYQDFLFARGEKISRVPNTENDYYTLSDYNTSAMNNHVGELNDYLECVNNSILDKENGIYFQIYSISDSSKIFDGAINGISIDSVIGGYNFSFHGIDNKITTIMGLTEEKFDSYIYSFKPKGLSNNIINNHCLSSFFDAMYVTINNEGDRSYTRYYYYLPPFIKIDKDTPSFWYSFTFRYNGHKYIGVQYEYHNRFTFLSGHTPGVPDYNLDFDLGISEDGKTLIFSLPRKDKITEDKLYTIEYLSTGVNGMNFITKTLIPHSNNFISGTYVLNTQSLKILNYKGTQKYMTFDKFFFKSGSKYFSQIILEWEYFPNDNQKTYLTVSYKNNFETIIPYRAYFQDNIWHDDVFNQEYSNIILDNARYLESEYQILKYGFYPSKVSGYQPPLKPGEGGSTIGGTDAFGLIGGAFSSIVSLFSIQLIPGVAIGTLFFLPLIVLIVLSIVGLFKR